MSYSDYWMKQYCQINLQYRTIETYHTVIEAHIKPKLGFYGLSQITTSAIQEFINALYVERGFSKAYLKSILKIVKSSFAYVFDIDKFKNNEIEWDEELGWFKEVEEKFNYDYYDRYDSYDYNY